jgi:hypothetical protein
MTRGCFISFFGSQVIPAKEKLGNDTALSWKEKRAELVVNY